MSDYRRPVPYLHLGSNFLHYNEYDTSSNAEFLNKSLFVRPFTEDDYINGVKLMSRIQNGSSTPMLSHTEILLALEAFIMMEAEDKCAQAIHLFRQRCRSTMHQDIPRSLSYVILHVTLPSINQTALWIGVRMQHEEVLRSLRTYSSAASLEVLEKSLFASALAVLRFPKSKQMHLDIVELALQNIPPCPPRTSRVNYWLPWFDPSVDLPMFLREAAGSHILVGLTYFEKCISMVEKREETGHLTLSQIKPQHFQGSSVHAETLQTSVSFDSPLYFKDSKSKPTPDFKERIVDQVKVEDALYGFLSFLSYYKACKLHESSIPEGQEIQYGNCCRKLWKGLRYQLSILLCPQRTKEFAVYYQSLSDNEHPVLCFVNSWFEEWKQEFKSMESSGVLNDENLEAVIMSRVVGIGDYMFETVFQGGHSFFKQVACFVWGALLAFAKTSPQKLHILIVLECYMRGMISEDDHLVAVCSVIRFMTEDSWHVPTVRETQGAESGDTRESSKSEPKLEPKLEPKPLRPELQDFQEKRLSTQITDSSFSQLALMQSNCGHHSGIQGSIVSSDMSIIAASLGLTKVSTHFKAEETTNPDGYVNGYVDLLCQWALQPTCYPQSLRCKPFRSLVYRQKDKDAVLALGPLELDPGIF